MLTLALMIALLQAPSPEPPRGSATLGLTVFVAGQAADLATTLVVLHQHRGYERNGVYGAHPSDARLIATTAAIVVPTALVLRALAPRHPRVARWLGIALGGVGAGAAVNNLAVWARAGA